MITMMFLSPWTTKGIIQQNVQALYIDIPKELNNKKHYKSTTSNMCAKSWKGLQ